MCFSINAPYLSSAFAYHLFIIPTFSSICKNKRNMSPFDMVVCACLLSTVQSMKYKSHGFWLIMGSNDLFVLIMYIKSLSVCPICHFFLKSIFFSSGTAYPRHDFFHWGLFEPFFYYYTFFIIFAFPYRFGFYLYKCYEIKIEFDIIECIGVCRIFRIQWMTCE